MMSCQKQIQSKKQIEILGEVGFPTQLKEKVSLHDKNTVFRTTKKEFTLVNFFNSDCSSCVTKLKSWAKHIKENEIEKDLDFLFIGYGKSLPFLDYICLLYTSPSPRDATLSRMPSSA